MFHYRFHGLSFRSELEFCGVGEVREEAPECLIRFGGVPRALEQPFRKGIAFEADAESLLLRVEGVGRFLVQDREILIERAPGASDRDLQVFVLGSCMGALLQRRHLLLLHAAAIETARGAIVIMAPSGRGKSTLASWFAQRGYSLLAEDCCRLTVDDGPASVAPEGLPVKLWSDAAHRLTIDASGLGRVREHQEKYFWHPPRASERPVSLYQLCVLHRWNQDRLEARRLNGRESLDRVLRNTYRPMYFRASPLARPHFFQAARLVQSHPVLSLTRPVSGDSVNALGELLCRELKL